MSHKTSNQTHQKGMKKSSRQQPEFSNEFAMNQAPKPEHYKQPKRTNDCIRSMYLHASYSFFFIV